MSTEMRATRSGESFHEFKKRSDVQQFPRIFCDYVKSYGDIYYWEKGKFHVITKSDHAKEILLSDAFSADRGSFFISRMPNMDLSLIQDFFSVVRKMMVMSDDEDHLKKRKLSLKGFDDQVLMRFKSVMSKTIDDLVASIKDKESFEFVSTISSKLPSTVLADLFCIPEGDRHLFLEHSNIMTGFFGGASNYQNEDGIKVNTSATFLKKYFERLIDERIERPGEDYVSQVLIMQKELNLTRDEVISQLIMMLVAGMATTTDQINNCLFLMVTHPEIQEEVRQKRNLLVPMLEEFKRLDPAVTFIFRVARKETMIGQQKILPGDVIFISTHAINRDMPVEDAPHEIRLNRIQNHFAYGFGPHFCIGAKLARMEINTLFEKLLDLGISWKLDQEKISKRDHYSLSFSGFSQIHLKQNKSCPSHS